MAKCSPSSNAVFHRTRAVLRPLVRKKLMENYILEMQLNMGKNITFGKLKISDLKHMGKNITFGIYKNILQLNNMGENGPTCPGQDLWCHAKIPYHRLHERNHGHD